MNAHANGLRRMVCGPHAGGARSGSLTQGGARVRWDRCTGYDPNQGNATRYNRVMCSGHIGVIYVVGKFVGVALFKSNRVRLVLSCPRCAITLNSL